MWVYFIIGAFFIAIGLAVHVLKWYFLISGYNTMSKEKKANVDIKALGRFMGFYCYVNGGAFILAGILYALEFEFGVTIAIGIVCISTVYLLIRAQRFDGNIYDKRGKLRKGAGKYLALPIGIFVVVLIFIGMLLFFSAQATEVTLLEEGIQIHGMYGDIYEWESIEVVNLTEDLPTIEMRTDGSALRANLKGYFRTKEHGLVKLFVNTQRPPFIYLQLNVGMTIFNMENADETRGIFEEIRKIVE